MGINADSTSAAVDFAMTKMQTLPMFHDHQLRALSQYAPVPTEVTSRYPGGIRPKVVPNKPGEGNLPGGIQTLIATRQRRKRRTWIVWRLVSKPLERLASCREESRRR